MLQLIAPDAAWRDAWREAHAEWGPGQHEDGFGLLLADDVGTRDGFDAWVCRLAADPRCTYQWIVEDGRVLGGIALRHEDHPGVPLAGHLGYGIRPSVRRRGMAVWAVKAMLSEAYMLQIPRILAVYEAGNLGSIRTLEAAGGVLEQSDDAGRVCRYWLSASPARESPGPD
ncbi:GNAT family N-acetyltransferase [Arthrobacter sp. zg-Y826]|uniref:GNAT family N-acetyltransferase n=1 Tax=Arthrobacter jinronghuae TaxID=2964609 RepID=UPI0021029028|nr:GNAT family N-acetyltransferase [Arthrobacter jinronghuae]MCQ1955793.1 GNAT family N-acetyltransferase [Arthrobacter jinronghuae]